MAKQQLVEVCDKHFKHIKFDEDLYNKIQKFRITWVNKSEIYVDFLGSNLLGIHPIRFSSVDEDMWFIDTLGIDSNQFKYDLYNNTDIDRTRAVSSNIVYISIVYLMHKFINNKLMRRKLDNVLEELYYVFAYKAMGSLISHYFKFETEEALAKAVYERLSNKFLIKKLGSWQAVFEYRSGDVKPPRGLHAKRLESLKTDEAERVIADLQGRLRETVKNIYEVLIDVMDNNERVKTSTMIEKGEDGDGIKDTSDNPSGYIRYVFSVIGNQNDFINDDIVYLLVNNIKNLDEKNLVNTLKYITNEIEVNQNDKDNFINVTIESAIAYLRTKKITGSYHKHMLESIDYLRNYWSSSSVKNRELKKTKKYLFDITNKATGKKTKWLLSTVSISVMLYIFVRSVYRR